MTLRTGMEHKQLEAAISFRDCQSTGNHEMTNMIILRACVMCFLLFTLEFLLFSLCFSHGNYLDVFILFII